VVGAIRNGGRRKGLRANGKVAEERSMARLAWLVVAVLGAGLLVGSRYMVETPTVAAQQGSGSLNDGTVGELAQTEAEEEPQLVGAGPFFTFLVGEALFLTGCSFLLCTLYSGLARKVTGGWLHEPFQELLVRRRLLLSLHLVYFGLVVGFFLVAYILPGVQHSLLSEVRGALPKPVVAAYKSGNIPVAAIATFLTNFFLGSLACITVPSLIVPGIGVLVPVVRSSLWGFLLAPTNPRLLAVMVPHSGTLLLEGAGYVLAAFFALMVPVYLFGRRREGETGGRYAAALRVNAKGNVLVLVVLAVAAIYEAVEVILQM
jgi:hypothetical protein